MYKIIVVFILLGIIQAPISYAQNSTIVVSGYAEQEIIPDQVKTSFHLENIADNYDQAIEELNQQTKSLSQTLIKQGFDQKDIKTLHFNARPHYEYRDGKRIHRGYVASQKLELQFDYNKETLGILIKAIAKGDAAPNFNIQFFVSDKQKTIAKEKLLAEAVKDARNTANILAKAAGSSISGFQEIRYGVSQEAPMPRYQADMMMAKSESADFAGLEAKEIKLSERVTITWVVE